MKDWFAKNEEAITKWMYRAIITMFAVNSVCDIVGGNASGALGWLCACIWCFIAILWRERAVMDEEFLTNILDKISKAMQDEKEGAKE